MEDRLPKDFERVTVPSVARWHAWVIADHYQRHAAAEGRQRTYVGDLLYRAKYRNDRVALDGLRNVVRHSVLQLAHFPARTDGLGSVSTVAAVPCNPPKPLSVPHEVARVAAAALGVADTSALVLKVRPTPEAKEDARLWPDAYEAASGFRDQTVLLVDDLYHTGTTLESVAMRLREAGAGHIVGLCVTKVHRGMTV